MAPPARQTKSPGWAVTTSPVFCSGMENSLYFQEFFRLLRCPKGSAPMPDMTTLRIAIGDYPHTLPLKRGEITSPSLKLDFVEVKPMHKAFNPMVREHAFDASEMALVTYLQAKAYNKGLRLLPAAMLARFQHGCMLFNAARGKLDPANLPGCRVGVRSYSQTTGAWLRGILENDYAVDLSRVH